MRLVFLIRTEFIGAYFGKLRSEKKRMKQFMDDESIARVKESTRDVLLKSTLAEDNERIQDTSRQIMIRRLQTTRSMAGGFHLNQTYLFKADQLESEEKEKAEKKRQDEIYNDPFHQVYSFEMEKIH